MENSIAGEKEGENRACAWSLLTAPLAFPLQWGYGIALFSESKMYVLCLKAQLKAPKVDGMRFYL